MAPSYLSKALLFYFVATAEAYTVFETTCSTPTTLANFVSSPDSRGTLDILWSSLFTIVACTWTVQHLNVPEQRHGRDPGWRGDLKWQLKGFYTSAKWMIITVVAPEFVIGMACYDLLAAKISLRELQEFAMRDQVPWTLTHSHYANMGGFVIQSMVQEALHAVPYIPVKILEANNRVDIVNEASADPKGTQGHGVRDSNWKNTKDLLTAASDKVEDPSYGDQYHLTATQIYKLRDNNILSKLPHINKGELNDKSKSDSFVKLIAISQIMWAMVQIIVRTARTLAISQLELAVIAFAACAAVMYILYWSKPKSVGTTTTILEYQGPIPQEVLELIEINCKRFGLFFTARETNRLRHGSRVRNDAIEDHHGATGGALTFAMILGAALFGGIHVGAWNFDFPSRIELIFWRCASIYSAAYGPVMGGTFVIIDRFTSFVKDIAKLVFAVILLFSTLLYMLARLFLLVEIFRTLCFLPPDAYISTWATNIPHVS